MNTMSLKLEDLSEYTDRMAHKWDRIGIKLQQDVRLLRNNSMTPAAETKLTTIFEKWIEAPPKDLPVEWSTIVTVLRSDSVKLTALAREIEEKWVLSQPQKRAQPLREVSKSLSEGHSCPPGGPTSLQQPSSGLILSQTSEGTPYRQSEMRGGPPSDVMPNQVSSGSTIAILPQEPATGGEFQERMDNTDGNPTSLTTVVEEKNKKFPVEFAIMTANENEWNTARHFLGDQAEDLACKIHDLLKNKEYSCSSVLNKEVRIEKVDGNYDGFKIIRIGGQKTVYGVLLKCSDMGSFTGGGSHRTTLRLLKMAQHEKWRLKVIFIVGCCGARFTAAKQTSKEASVEEAGNTQQSETSGRPDEENDREGAVFIAKDIVQYAIGKFEREREIKYNVRIHNVSKDWDGIMDAEKDSKRRIDPVHKVLFYSGDFVIKTGDVAADLSGQILSQPKVGFEMEGIGVTKAIDDWTLLSGGELQPEIVLVKGVSDQAGTDKKYPKDTMFFSKLMKEVPEDARQQMCTVMSLSLALRAIIVRRNYFSGPSDKLVT